MRYGYLTQYPCSATVEEYAVFVPLSRQQLQGQTSHGNCWTGSVHSPKDRENGVFHESNAGAFAA